ncbi:MAG: ATP-binding protein, partial [Bacteroidales bacterium]
ENLNVYTEISMNPIVAQGKIIGVSVFARDITARKLAEIMLKEKNKEIEARNAEYLHLNEKLLKATEDLILAKNKAEESDRMKTSFLQNMSHEIRTPMNAIMGFSSLLTSQYNNRHKLEQYSDIINNRCKDLLEIINDILDIAKIESGQFAVNEEECNLHQLNAELLTFFGEHQIRAGKGHIHFTLKSFEDDSETIVMADKGKLKQIFINLIGNAFKFTDKGKIEGGYIIEDKHIKFYISDTGIGIPDDKKDYIFERFAQINQSGNRLYGGTGLGLAIVKGLVNLLGGKVSVDSELGKGSTFYFTIPYKPIHHEKKHMNASEKDEELRFNGIKILIVEDDRYNAQYLQEILTEANFIVYCTAFGKEALPIITENKIPIVLMDIRLPDINGYQVTNTIKEVFPDTIIIAQTAYAAPEDKTRALESGCNDYISKPIKKELLLNMIKKHLNI